MATAGLIRVCDSASLGPEGCGFRFDVSVAGRAATAFVLRWRGQVVSYLNQCAHVPMELDWVAGEFLDSEKEFIVCATHGAIYDPQGGQCLGGPCRGRGGLRRIEVLEQEGAIWWQPDDVVTAPVSAPEH